MRKKTTVLTVIAFLVAAVLAANRFSTALSTNFLGSQILIIGKVFGVLIALVIIGAILYAVYQYLPRLWGGVGGGGGVGVPGSRWTYLVLGISVVVAVAIVFMAWYSEAFRRAISETPSGVVWVFVGIFTAIFGAFALQKFGISAGRSWRIALTPLLIGLTFVLLTEVRWGWGKSRTSASETIVTPENESRVITDQWQVPATGWSRWFRVPAGHASRQTINGRVRVQNWEGDEYLIDPEKYTVAPHSPAGKWRFRSEDGGPVTITVEHWRGS